LEFYLDDILIECFSLPADATGRIGLIRGSDSRAIGNLKAWHARPEWAATPPALTP
jgi:hypothetical protein